MFPEVIKCILYPTVYVSNKGKMDVNNFNCKAVEYGRSRNKKKGIDEKMYCCCSFLYLDASLFIFYPTMIK